MASCAVIKTGAAGLVDGLLDVLGVEGFGLVPSALAGWGPTTSVAAAPNAFPEFGGLVPDPPTGVGGGGACEVVGALPAAVGLGATTGAVCVGAGVGC
ncbi:MAG: hypothetical protein JOZ98_03210 [Solirubrobacterales bacterium]|nr:hypothetical protein [Solirubrobacterales bacterium]MBV9421894.1 hypothetical protein [Solirubrobacterales bacterium]MBV9800715.1 hypothetical protein [Solirubrobacterales bacterium]